MQGQRLASRDHPGLMSVFGGPEEGRGAGQSPSVPAECGLPACSTANFLLSDRAGLRGPRLFS